LALSSCGEGVATHRARVAELPAKRPILALGADLKNAVTLVVNGQAFVSQHIGDLEHFQSFRAFRETVHDLVTMYEVSWDELMVVHDFIRSMRRRRLRRNWRHRTRLRCSITAHTSHPF
jgi:hydrogenase maturation factor HypF (carbamoyltransferase family)